VHLFTGGIHAHYCKPQCHSCHTRTKGRCQSGFSRLTSPNPPSQSMAVRVPAPQRLPTQPRPIPAEPIRPSPLRPSPVHRALSPRPAPHRIASPPCSAQLSAAPHLAASSRPRPASPRRVLSCPGGARPAQPHPASPPRPLRRAKCISLHRPPLPRWQAVPPPADTLARWAVEAAERSAWLRADGLGQPDSAPTPSQRPAPRRARAQSRAGRLHTESRRTSPDDSDDSESDPDSSESDPRHPVGNSESALDLAAQSPNYQYRRELVSRNRVMPRKPRSDNFSTPNLSSTRPCSHPWPVNHAGGVPVSHCQCGHAGAWRSRSRWGASKSLVGRTSPDDSEDSESDPDQLLQSPSAPSPGGTGLLLCFCCVE
jgi:hypothetical protein